GSSSRMTSGRASGRARWRALAGALEIITAPTPNSVLEQELDEPGGAVPALAAAGFEARVELVDERGDRQGGAAFPRLVEADAHVLAHPLGGEAEALGLELVHLLPAVFHLPGLRRTLGDHADNPLDIQLVPLGEGHPFCEAL